MALASCPARQRQQRSLRRIRQLFELDIGALGWTAKLGMSAAGLFLRDGLCRGPGRRCTWSPAPTNGAAMP